MTVLGGLCLFLVPPVALIVSVIGLVRGPDRVAATIGLVLSGLCLLLFVGFPLLTSLCK